MILLLVSEIYLCAHLIRTEIKIEINREVSQLLVGASKLVRQLEKCKGLLHAVILEGTLSVHPQELGCTLDPYL